MGNLSNLYVSRSFQSLIHIATDNTASANLIGLEDGYGNPIGVSVNTAGDLSISGSFTASLQNGYVWVGNSSGKTTTVATSSFGTPIPNGTISGSSQITALGFVSSSITASSLITASFDNGTRNLTFTKGNNTTFAVNIPDTSGSVIPNGVVSGSQQIIDLGFLQTSSFNSYTASQSTASLVTSINNLNTFTQSANISINALNAATSSYVTEAETGSFATTGSNAFIGNQRISGDLIVTSSNEIGFIVTGGALANPQILMGGLGSPNDISMTANDVNMTLNNGDLKVNTNTANRGVQIEGTDPAFTLRDTSSPLNPYIALINRNQRLEIVDANGTIATMNTASFNIPSASFTASLQQGYVWVGDASGKTTTVATSSFGSTINTGSFVTTSSFNSYTASTDSSISQLNASSASQQVSIDALNTNSASVNTSITNVNSATASLFTSVNNINTFTQSAQTSINALNAATSSYATSAITASSLVTASLSGQTLTFTKGDNSTFGIQLPDVSGSDISALNAFTASQLTINSGYNTFTQSIQAEVDSLQAATSSYVTSAITASSLVTASAAGNTLTFTKGDASTFSVSVDTGSAATTIFEVVYTGENITKGDPLYISGSQGANPKVFKADAADAAKMPVTFVSNETIGVNNTTNAIVLGLIEGIDLTGYTAGQAIYVAEGGGWSTSLPSGSNSVTQLLGVVTKGGSGGKGLVLNPGPAQLPGLDSGKLWVGGATNQPTEITTASFASSASFNSYTASVNTSISNLNSFTQSQEGVNTVLAGEIDSLQAKTGSYATTGSNNFIGDQNITGNITAFSASFTYLQTIYESSSIIYSSGSNQFGDELSDVQTLSGSVKVQGSLTVNGTPVLTSSVDISGLVTTASFNAYTQSNDSKVNSLINATASYATSAITASSLVTASFDNGTRNLTFTKGDTTTFSVNIPDVSGSTGDFATTGSNQFNGNQTVNGFVSASNGFKVGGGTTALEIGDGSNIRFLTGSSNYYNIQLVPGVGDIAFSRDGVSNVKTFTLGGAAGNNTTFQNNPVQFQSNVGNVIVDAPLAINSGINSNVQLTGSINVSNLGNSNVAGTGSNTFTGNQTIANGAVLTMQTGSTINLFESPTGTSAIRFWSGSTITGDNPRWVNFQPQPGGGGTLAISAFPENNHFVFFNPASWRTQFESVVTGFGDTTRLKIGEGLQVTGSIITNFIESPTGSNVLILSKNNVSLASDNGVRVGAPNTDSNGIDNGNISMQVRSGSLSLAPSGFTNTTGSLLHLSSSSNTNFVNLMFKNNGGATPTTISGSNNIFTNQTNVTAGFFRYLGGNNNYFSAALPQLTGSAAFSPSMNNNFAATGMILRAPVSSSAYAINSNVLLGFGVTGINLGTSAANHFERAVSGLTMQNNVVAGGVNAVASKTPLSSSVNIGNNMIGGQAQLNMDSSSINLNGTTIQGTLAVNNSYFPSTYTISSANMAVNAGVYIGNNNLIYASGSNATFTQGRSVASSAMIGGSNTFSASLNGDRAQINSTILLGQSLVAIGSNSLPAAQTAADWGSVFVGRWNSLDGTKDLTAETIFAVGTGTGAATRKTGFLIDSGSNTFVEGTLNVSGSTTINGNTTITGSLILSSSAAIELDVIGNVSVSGSINVNSGSYNGQVVTNVTPVSSSLSPVLNIVTMTSAEYALITPNSQTLYLIV